MLYSRQGTTDTIEEVEDEQDQGEDKKQVSRESQKLDEEQEAERVMWSDQESRPREEEEGEKKEEEGGERQQSEVGEEGEDAPWESFGPDEGPSFRPEEAEPASIMQQNDYSESEDGGGHEDFLQTKCQGGQLYTPDTDASKTSDADVPPSYSKAVSFDRLELSDDESDTDRKRRMVMTSDSRSDSRSDIMLPSMTTELTASELLLNK